MLSVVDGNTLDVRQNAKKYTINKKQTQKTLLVRHGASVKEFRMQVISNSAFEQVHRYHLFSVY